MGGNGVIIVNDIIHGGNLSIYLMHCGVFIRERDFKLFKHRFVESRVDFRKARQWRCIRNGMERMTTSWLHSARN